MDEELFPIHNNSLVLETDDQHEVILLTLASPETQVALTDSTKTQIRGRLSQDVSCLSSAFPVSFKCPSLVFELSISAV